MKLKFHKGDVTTKVTIHKSEKGLYAKGEEIPFGIIDRSTTVPLLPGEEWEVEIVKKVTDRRGKEVPILRPVKKIYKPDTSRGVLTCGSHMFNLSLIRIEEIKKGLLEYEVKGEASFEGESFSFSVPVSRFLNWNVTDELKEKVREKVRELQEENKEKFKKFLEEKKREEFHKFIEFLKGKILESKELAEKRICELLEKIHAIKIWTCEISGEFPESQRQFIYGLIDPDTGEIPRKKEIVAKFIDEIEKIQKELEEWERLSLEEKIKIVELDLDIEVQIYRFRVYKFKGGEFTWEKWSFVKDWLFPE